MGWTVAVRENAQVAKNLIQTCCERQGIGFGELTLHADHGQTMKPQPAARQQRQPILGGPVQDAQVPARLPGTFGSLEDAAGYCRPTFDWYNHEHRHVGLGLLTPADVHYGRAHEVMTRRQQVLTETHNAHPMRFRRAPAPPHLPREIWINRPEPGVVLVGSPTTA